MDRLRLLQKSRAIEVLIALYKESEAGLADTVSLCGSSTSVVVSRLMELKEAGFITERREQKAGGRRLFKLTDEGKKLAKKLIEIEKMLS